MSMNRGIWLILSAVVLVVIGLFTWSTANRTPEAPPATQTPAAVTGVQPTAKDAVGAGSTQTGEQKSASAPAPEAAIQTAQKEPAPAQQNGDAAPSQTANKETAPEPPPQPTTTASPKTAEQETPPKPAATAPAGLAPASEMEAQPPSASAPSAPQPVAAPTAQIAEKESTPASAPSRAAAPDAPAGEKEPVATDKDAEAHANDRANAELAVLQPGFVPRDLVAALNESVISFASDSAEVPTQMTDFLQKAAEDLKQLPKGHVLEVAGYTDNTGDQALNVALSQKRAEAVRQMLIKFGADPEMLIAKGYGSADPVASNDTPEGRRRNRRIEYHIVKTP